MFRQTLSHVARKSRQQAANMTHKHRTFATRNPVAKLQKLSLLNKTDKMLAEIEKIGGEMKIPTTCPVNATAIICTNLRTFDLAYEIYECMEIGKPDSFGGIFHAGMLHLMQESLKLEDGLPEAARAFNRIINMGRQLDALTAERFLNKLVAKHDIANIVKFFSYDSCVMTDKMLVRGADALILSHNMHIFADAFQIYMSRRPIHDDFSYYNEERKICTVLAASIRALTRLKMGSRRFIHSEPNEESIKSMEKSFNAVVDPLMKEGHRIEKYSARYMFETLRLLSTEGSFSTGDKPNTHIFQRLPRYEYVAGDRHHMISANTKKTKTGTSSKNMPINDLTSSLASVPNAEEKPLLFLSKMFPEEAASEADLLENTGLGVFDWLRNRPEGAVEWEYAKTIDSSDMDEEYDGEYGEILEGIAGDDIEFVNIEFRDDFEDGDNLNGNSAGITAGFNVGVAGKSANSFLEKFRRTARLPRLIRNEDGDDEDDNDDDSDDDGDDDSEDDNDDSDTEGNYFDQNLNNQFDEGVEQEPRLRLFDNKMYQLGHMSRAYIPQLGFDIKDLGYALDYEADKKAKMRKTRRKNLQKAISSKSIAYEGDFFREFDTVEEEDGRLNRHHRTGDEAPVPVFEDEDK